jgi:hypothetical protein
VLLTHQVSVACLVLVGIEGYQKKHFTCENMKIVTTTPLVLIAVLRSQPALAGTAWNI